MKRANMELVTTVESEILEEMQKFDTEHEKNLIFTVTRQYMKMVMLQFIRAVRTADWKLHLQSLQVFTKYFFAHDHLNYARMIPLY